MFMICSQEPRAEACATSGRVPGPARGAAPSSVAAQRVSSGVAMGKIIPTIAMLIPALALIGHLAGKAAAPAHADEILTPGAFTERAAAAARAAMPENSSWKRARPTARRPAPI